MVKTAANPGGLPIEVFDGIRAGVLADRSQFFKDRHEPVLRLQPPGAKVSQGLRDSFWLQGMQGGLQERVTTASRRFPKPTSRKTSRRFDVPTLIMHGDDDQIVPIADSALLSAKIVKNATPKIYKGAPHGLCSTLKDEVNSDLLAFIKGKASKTLK